MRRSVLAVLLIIFATAANADEARGVVVYNKGCGSRIVIETPQGYVVAVWQNGVAPRDGETLVGDLNASGVTRAYNINTDGGGTLRVEAHGLSQSRAAQVLKSKCR
jgi:hypothetical protein